MFPKVFMSALKDVFKTLEWNDKGINKDFLKKKQQMAKTSQTYDTLTKSSSLPNHSKSCGEC